MLKQTTSTIALLAFVGFFSLPAAHADDGAAIDGDTSSSQGAPGSSGNTSDTTDNNHQSNSSPTSNQNVRGLQYAGLGGLAEIHGPTGRNGLPDTSTGSFVNAAGGMAELIYGGDGSDGPPVFEEFDPSHRIERGIQGVQAEGLTTGHGSPLPSASGGDEFVKSEPFSQAGSSSGGTTWSKPAVVGPDPGTKPETPESGF